MGIGLEARECGLPEGMPGLDKLKLPTKIDSLKRIIFYKFYRKPVATKPPMNARSAQPQQMKMQTATDEFLRRLKTTSRELPPTTIDQVLTEYASDLKRGGHQKDWVKEALRNALAGYAKMVKNELQGICPINRPEATGKNTRRLKKLVGNSTWFSKNNGNAKHTAPKTKGQKQKHWNTKQEEPPETIVYVPNTPNSDLKKQKQKLRTVITCPNLEKSEYWED